MGMLQTLSICYSDTLIPQNLLYRKTYSSCVASESTSLKQPCIRASPKKGTTTAPPTYGGIIKLKNNQPVFDEMSFLIINPLDFSKLKAC